VDNIVIHRKITADLRFKWQMKLTEIGRQPLTFCPEFSEVGRRWDKWWSFQSERPLLVASAKKRDDIYWGKGLHLLDQPAEWLRLRRIQVENTHYVAEALPSIRVDIGPVSMGAFLGAPLHLSEETQTVWQESIIESWDDLSCIKLDHEGGWLQRVLNLTAMTAEDGAGRYLVCLPDMSGPIDVLANLRGTERLCIDLYEAKQEIIKAAMLVLDVWESVYATMYEAILSRGAGLNQWLGCWSGGAPYIIPTCDFNALLGESDFREVCMPSLREEALRVGLCVFHLDGPDASRHARTLAEESAITALQYTPGAGTRSALAKLGMLKMFQQAGKPVFVVCPKGEVEELADRLDPKGLVLMPDDIETPREADELFEILVKMYP